MYVPEKKLILLAGKELKKRVPFLSRWKVEYGKKAQNPAADALITARNKTGVYNFCVEIKRAGYPQYVKEAALSLKEFIKDNPPYYPIIVAPKISEQGKAICDKYNIGYMDFSGNTKIIFKSILIKTAGKIGQPQLITHGLVGQQSIFSPKAVRITKVLLYQPHKTWSQKDIINQTGLSKGMVSRVVRRMIDAGFLMEKDGKFALYDFDDLLAAWLEVVIKRRQFHKRYYAWAQNPQQLMRIVADELNKRKTKYAFTQEAGASLVAPFSTFDIVSLYIEDFDKFPSQAFSAAETEKGFNLVLMAAPDEAVFQEAQAINGIKVTDNLQLYVDLKKNPLRGDKQAGHILNIIKKGLDEKKRVWRVFSGTP